MVCCVLCVYNNFPFVIMSPLSSGEYERIDVAGAIPAARRTCGVVYPMSNTEQKWVEIDSAITVDQHTSVHIVDGVWINKKNYFHWHFLRNSIRKPYRHRCRPIIDSFNQKRRTQSNLIGKNGEDFEKPVNRPCVVPPYTRTTAAVVFSGKWAMGKGLLRYH